MGSGGGVREGARERCREQHAFASARSRHGVVLVERLSVTLARVTSAVGYHWSSWVVGLFVRVFVLRASNFSEENDNHSLSLPLPLSLSLSRFENVNNLN